MRIAIVAFSPVARDSRVLRTSRALAEHGHEVHLIGYGACPDIGSGRFHSLGPAPTRLAHWIWVIAGYAPANLSPRLSRFTAPLRPLHRRCDALLRQIRPDVIHANDWPVLPVAMMTKKETGVRIVYDSHEFAREEHGARWLWRLLYRPHVCATEAAGLREADRVVTIGPGIAKLMAQAYSLPRPPLVIANVPEYRAVAPHPVGPRLELLYHGLMTEGRGLETLIMAVARMRRDVRLVLRGDGAPRYVDNLRRLVASCATPERIRFEPAVPIEEAIEAASHSDIGLFTPPLLTPQARFMLPNKLFEYLMAGLMVIVSDADDMAEIVRRYECGRVLADVSPFTLAATLDALELEEISRCNDRARASARSLCWERERDKLIGLYAELAEAVRT
jgi:glycosyltransferase involved in cell wall biosynthesis